VDREGKPGGVSDEEIAMRRDEALRRALSTPPQPRASQKREDESTGADKKKGGAKRRAPSQRRS
jgi:hypothetical protein